MSVQYSTTLRNNRADQVESTIGTAPKLQIFSGAKPENCGSADSGTLLAELTLPSDWLTAASSGQKTINGGPWAGTGGAGAGAGTNAGHFRIKDNAGTTCHMQGDCSASGGGGDMILSNVNIANGQAFSVTAFTHTEGNA